MGMIVEDRNHLVPFHTTAWVLRPCPPHRLAAVVVHSVALPSLAASVAASSSVASDHTLHLAYGVVEVGKDAAGGDSIHTAPAALGNHPDPYAVPVQMSLAQAGSEKYTSWVVQGDGLAASLDASSLSHPDSGLEIHYAVGGPCVEDKCGRGSVNTFALEVYTAEVLANMDH